MAKLITENELADWFRQSVFTVRRVRTVNPERHPPYRKIGSSVRYDVDEVQRWLDSHTVNAMDAPVPAPVHTPKEKRPGPGRPPKAETVRKTKNADR